MEKYYLVLQPDNEDLEYKYSEGLFYWFYKRLKAFSFDVSVWDVLEGDNEIDFERTKRDHEDGGCRIWLKDRKYLKIYECQYLIEFSKEELQNIKKTTGLFSLDELKVSDIVNYFYAKQ